MNADSRRDLPQHIFVNCFGLASTVNGTQQTCCFVVVDQRLRLLFVSCQTGFYGFHVVVGAMYKLRFRMKVANIIELRRLEIDVVDLTTHRTVSPSGHALLEQFAWHVDLNRNDIVPLLHSQFLETGGLRRSAWKTVEDVAVPAIGLRG